MKSEFMLAITQLAAEKKLPLEVVLEVVESALASAFKKDSFSPTQEVWVKLNPNTGKVAVRAEMQVVDTVTDPRSEITLADAKKIRPDVELGEAVEVEATPRHAGRIAAQTARQVVLQRLHEAEREIVFEEFSDREGQIITGIVQRVEPRQIVLDLGRTEGILPNAEQVRSERYRIGQRLKVCLLEVHRSSKGPQVFVSRTHPNLLRGLLELEVPEMHSGVVELKSIAREAGNRSKIAVAASQPGVDAVGSCVGLRGIRIQNIVNELNGEKIDIVEWSPEEATFIANALSPAQVSSVELNEEEKAATVVVPDRQLSLAIGKEGQNARLAAKLSGWRIDIKSSSVAEAERAVLAEQVALTEQALVTEEVVEPAEEPAVEEEALEPSEVVATEEEAAAAEEVPVAEGVTAEEELPVAEPVLVGEDELSARSPQEYIESLVLQEEEEEEEEEEFEEEPVAVQEVVPVRDEAKSVPQIRFAEDIFPSRRAKGERKGKKGKGRGKAETKGTTESRGRGESEAKPRKARRAAPVVADEEEPETW